jgi:protoporphyrinogen oxidase
MEKIPILGAGVSGLGAATVLKEKSIILEKNNTIGGLCRSKIINGFSYEYGTHVFFTKNQQMIKILEETLKGNISLNKAEIWNYSNNSFFPHPVQVNSVYLQEELKIRCLISYIKNLIERRNVNKLRNYKDWCLYNFGSEFSNEFLLKYAEKFWTIPAEKLNLDWVSGRVLNPNVEDVVTGAFKKNMRNLHYINQFRYPNIGGFGEFIKQFSKNITNIELNKEITSINLDKQKITINNDKTITFNHCLSSIPLPEYLRLCETLPVNVRGCLEKLNWTSILLINIALNKSIKTNKHYEYYYDDEVPFFRAYFPHNLSKSNVVPNKGSISLEIAYNGKLKISKTDMQEQSIESLKEIGYIRSANDIIFTDFENIKYAYVIYDSNRADSISKISEYFHQFNLYPFGRYGKWAYLWSDQSFFDGINSAKEIIKDLGE